MTFISISALKMPTNSFCKLPPSLSSHTAKTVGHSWTQKLKKERVFASSADHNGSLYLTFTVTTHQMKLKPRTWIAVVNFMILSQSWLLMRDNLMKLMQRTLNCNCLTSQLLKTLRSLKTPRMRSRSLFYHELCK